MTDSYGKLLERLWDDPEMQDLPDRDFRIFSYLISNQHRSICGIYRLAVPTVAHELRKRQEDVELALFHRLTAWVLYDPRTDEVWVRSLASVNLNQAHDSPLPTPKDQKKPDSRVVALRKGLKAVRSQWLLRSWLSYYATWNEQLGLELPPPVEAPTLTLIRVADAPSHAPSTPDSSSRYQVADSSSSTFDSTNRTAEPTGLRTEPTAAGKREAGQLMPLVRKHLYVPDGKPPAGYDDGRDFGILATLLESVTVSDMEVAIEGLAILRDQGELEGIARPGEKLTMRALYNTHHGIIDTLTLAQNAYWKHASSRTGKGTGMTPLNELLRGVAR